MYHERNNIYTGSKSIDYSDNDDVVYVTIYRVASLRKLCICSASFSALICALCASSADNDKALPNVGDVEVSTFSQAMFSFALLLLHNIDVYF